MCRERSGRGVRARRRRRRTCLVQRQTLTTSRNETKHLAVLCSASSLPVNTSTAAFLGCQNDSALSILLLYINFVLYTSFVLEADDSFTKILLCLCKKWSFVFQNPLTQASTPTRYCIIVRRPCSKSSRTSVQQLRRISRVGET